MNYVYVDKEGNIIGEQISMFDTLDINDEDEEDIYDDSDDYE